MMLRLGDHPALESRVFEAITEHVDQVVVLAVDRVVIDRQRCSGRRDTGTEVGLESVAADLQLPAIEYEVIVHAANLALASAHASRRALLLDADLRQPDRSLDVVRQMLSEIDPIVDALDAMGLFDLDRAAIGGVSAGGMTALARLCTEHRFRCVAVEATTGSWRHQTHRPMFRDRGEAAAGLDPIEHLDGWREVPFQALHARYDEWVPIEGQQVFIDALRRHYRDPHLIEFIRYDRTGAAYEHAGFGCMASEAKNQQLDFLKRRLLPSSSPSSSSPNG